MKLFGNRKTHHRHAAGETAPGGSGAKKKREHKFRNTAFGKKWMKIPGVYRGLILLLLSVLILAGVCSAIYFTVVKPPDISVSRKPTKTTVVTEIDPETGEEIEVETEVPVSHKEGYYNILIAGTDGDGGRTDTIIVARLDTVEHSVALLSIPRDTLIVGNYAVPKINSVYGYGSGGEAKDGMENLKKYVTGVLGFEVDGYVLVDLDAFIQIVDLVGGVYFDVPQRMYYSDPSQDLYIDLAPGYQLLDGKQAMGLVRYRSYAQADIQRISVQQEFLKALAKQCLQIGNVAKIQEFAEILSESLVTDLTVGNMVYFGQELLKCNFDEMEMYTPEGAGVDIRGGSYYALYKSSVLEIVNEHFNPYEEEITGSDLTLLVDYSTAKQKYGSSGSSSGSGTSSSSNNSDTTTDTPDTTDQPTVTDPTTDPGFITEPGDTTDSGDTTDTTNSGDTTEPGDTTDSGDTTEPGDTTAPENPTDSGNTTEPDAPTDSGNTSEPDDTTDSGSTPEPDNPTEPSDPADPGDGGFIVE